MNPPSNGPLRVLVVDDNVDAADSLALLLQVQGHEVETAYAPDDALARAREGRHEVVLLDIGLPQMDGYEVARRIRQARPGEDVCLVALTGYGQPEDRRRASEAGFDHHLVKPVDFDAIEKILSAVSGRRH